TYLKTVTEYKPLDS
ncbi:MAG TPA: hypothetical protein PLV69_07400, partial [Blautia wexlerae]|nr:hypothetical protein [Blautia wexlerae]